MIKIIQCTCPNRHAIMGALFRDEDLTDVEMEIGFRELIQKALPDIGDHCGLCGKKHDTWIYEIGVCKEQDWAKAAALVQEEEREQLRSRALLRALGLTHDSGFKRHYDS